MCNPDARSAADYESDLEQTYISIPKNWMISVIAPHDRSNSDVRQVSPALRAADNDSFRLKTNDRKY